MEILQMMQKILKKINRGSMTCGTISNSLKKKMHNREKDVKNIWTKLNKCDKNINQDI